MKEDTLYREFEAASASPKIMTQLKRKHAETYGEKLLQLNASLSPCIKEMTQDLQEIQNGFTTFNKDEALRDASMMPQAPKAKKPRKAA